MLARENVAFLTLRLDFIEQAGVLLAFFQVVRPEQGVGQQQNCNCGGLLGGADVPDSVGYPVLVEHHRLIELLKHPNFPYGLRVLHLGLHSLVFQHFGERVLVPGTRSHEQDLLQDAVLLEDSRELLGLALCADVLEKVVLHEPGRGNDEALNLLKVDSEQLVEAELEEGAHSLLLQLRAALLLRNALLDLRPDERDRGLDVAEVGHPLVHHEGGDLYVAERVLQLLDDAVIAGIPVLLEDGEGRIQRDLERVDLTEREVLVLLDVLALELEVDRFAGVVADGEDLQRQDDFELRDLLHASPTFLHDLARSHGLHAVPDVDQVVDVPDVFLLGRDQMEKPCVLDDRNLEHAHIESKF